MGRGWEWGVATDLAPFSERYFFNFFFSPGTGMINTSKGCFALLNNIICLTASLIESLQRLLVKGPYLPRNQSLLFVA